MRRATFHLADPQLDRLRSWSEGTGLSVAELVRRALDAYQPPDTPPPHPSPCPQVSRESRRGQPGTGGV